MFTLFSLALLLRSLPAIAAVLPAIFLLLYIYRLDKVEHEPPTLVIALFFSGALSGLAAIILERIGTRLLTAFGPDPATLNYTLLYAFLVVALSEEAAKFFFVYRRTWKHPAFNYRFDGLVYFVCVSLGFAALENLLYLASQGSSVLLGRSLLSIPGHASFAVLGGIFYGRAKLARSYGSDLQEKGNLLLSLLLPTLLHGLYDACLMVGSTRSLLSFVGIVIIVYLLIFYIVRREARTDRPV